MAIQQEIFEDFSQWMNDHSTLSQSSIEKYTRSVKTVSKEMCSLGVISKPLFDMTLTELDLALTVILKEENFLEKNRRGNNMYSSGLKQFRYYIVDNYDYKDRLGDKMIDDITRNTEISETDKIALIKSRIGQGEFRKSLMKKYNGKCVISGVDINRILIASHIIPWAVSDNSHRLSVDNGLLLSANYDKLFDSGLISFKDNGQMLISSFVNSTNRNKLGLTSDKQYNLKTTLEMSHNLEYHRDIIFVK